MIRIALSSLSMILEGSYSKGLTIIGLLILGGFVSFSADAVAREWTDATGAHRVEAEYVGQEAGRVTLRRPDGQTVTLGLEALSADDQQYVAERRGAQTRVWTATTGQQVEALLLAATQGYVRLKKADGPPISVRLSLLIEEDRAYVAGVFGRAAEPSGEADAAAGTESSPPSSDFAGQFAVRKERAGTDAEALAALAIWCRDRGLDAEALEMERAALSLEPDDARVRRILGQKKDETTDQWVADPWFPEAFSSAARLPARLTPGILWFERNPEAWPVMVRRIGIVFLMPKSDQLPGLNKKNSPAEARGWLDKTVLVDPDGGKGNLLQHLAAAELLGSGFDPVLIVNNEPATLSELLKRHADADAFLVASFEPEPVGEGLVKNVIGTTVSFALYGSDQTLLLTGRDMHVVRVPPQSGPGTLAILCSCAAQIIDDSVGSFLQTAWMSPGIQARLRAVPKDAETLPVRQLGSGSDAVTTIEYKNETAARSLLLMSGPVMRRVMMPPGLSWQAQLPPGRYSIALISADAGAGSRIVRTTNLLGGNKYRLDSRSEKVQPAEQARPQRARRN